MDGLLECMHSGVPGLEVCSLACAGTGVREDGRIERFDHWLSLRWRVSGVWEQLARRAVECGCADGDVLPAREALDLGLGLGGLGGGDEPQVTISIEGQ